MIIAVGSDKGSPGATTLATVLGLVWPGDRVLVELDPRGADLPFRLKAGSGEHMLAQPSVSSLAIAARPGAAAPQLMHYAQQTRLGIPVIRGEVSTRASSKVAPHLPAIAQLAASWPGAVIADVGSLQANNPALVVAKAASVVLLVMRATTEGLGHLRARVEELAEYVGDPRRARTSVGIVLVSDSRDQAGAVTRTNTLLDSIGSPAPVVGVFRHDPAAAELLWSEPLGKRLLKSAMVRSGSELTGQLWRLWPEAMNALSWQPAQTAASAQYPSRQPPTAQDPVRQPPQRPSFVTDPGVRDAAS